MYYLSCFVSEQDKKNILQGASGFMTTIQPFLSQAVSPENGHYMYLCFVNPPGSCQLISRVGYFIKAEEDYKQ